MPQIAQLADTFASQIFWMLVIFGLVFLVVGRGMVPRVIDTVGQRDQRIADNLAGAKAARDMAEQQENAWRDRQNAARAKAQAVIARAKAEAQATSAARLDEVQARLDLQLDEAGKRIEDARAKAATGIEDVAAEAARQIVGRIAGIAVDEADARNAVRGVRANG